MAYTGKTPIDHTDVTQSQSMTVTDDLTVGGDLDAATAVFDRASTDGTIVDLQKDGTSVGSIGAFSTSTSYTGASSGIYFNGVNINPTTGDPTVRTDNINNIGQSSQRFKDLYLGGGVYLGGTGSANHLEDYEEGTWIPVLKAGGGTKTWSYNGQAGKYTKIGDTVTVWFNLQLSSNGSGTDGNAYIDGLPFANGVGFSVYTVAWKQLLETSEVGLMLRLDNANSYFWVIDGSSSYPDISYINTSNFLSDRRIRGQFTYKV